MNDTLDAEELSRVIGRRKCRACGEQLEHTFADLGLSPLANSFLSPAHVDQMESFYPLHAFVCGNCFLVQLAEFQSPADIFRDYLYFSSFSDSWLEHARRYVEEAIKRYALKEDDLVVEIASNDGYLLQYFRDQEIPVLGIEPAENVASAATAKGIKTEVAFFGAATAERLAKAGCSPRLMVANNVLAHVPDIHDFIEGFRILLSRSGVATFEFPHLLRLVADNQFDTIYHEHFSYLSLHVVKGLFAAHDLRLFDVEELSTHGGSLRISICHATNQSIAVAPTVARILADESAAGLLQLDTYREFAQRVVNLKCELLAFLIKARRAGKTVAAYGAPAKGNTLLNYCGVGPELIAYTVDRSPHKQGLLLPGTRIPIKSPDEILSTRPDYVLILPWNLAEEIKAQMHSVNEWGGRFVVPIPEVRML